VPPFPELRTERLVLRQFHIRDAGRVRELASARELAVGTFLPHPYKEGMAERWILSLIDDYEKDRMINFAIDLAGNGLLIGSMGIVLDLTHNHGQLGYWIGLPFWNKGYCSEAAQAVLAFGFGVVGLNRIWAPHFKSNPASGRVLQKIGMQYEGCQRQQFRRFGRYEDAELYGIVRGDFESFRQPENGLRNPPP